MINFKQSQRYSVLRVWIDKDIRQGVPFFIFTDALKILDSVTIYHRMEKTSEKWVKKNGGGIFELHSYAVPDDFPKAEIRNQFLKEFEEYFPEIKGYKIKYEYLQVKDDFTAFHTNLYKNRPTVKTEVENLFLAGDWVKLENPAMLMEAATTSEHPNFFNQMITLKQSQRYSVLRVWIDKDLRQGVPFFIFTDALKILDSVTIYHRMEKASEEWVKKNGGGIFELHSYAVPDDFPQAEVRNQFLKEFEEYFPEIKQYKVKYEYLQVKDDFTAFHTNLYKNRPTVKTEVENLFLAGDWVKLDNPSMLMEAATTSALYAANAIFSKEGLREETNIFCTIKGNFCLMKILKYFN